ncbi:MAG: histidine decarboxylase [Gammaproteobacteria bacterium]|nr:histidine decarboxylase [Gammaproteobacteria bacterium]
MLSRQDQSQLADFLDYLRDAARVELGYPVAFDIDYQELAPFLSHGLNNIGDPFKHGSYKLNSHRFEREVVQFFAEMTRAPQDDWWGYVTNGSTEGNLYGLYLARETLANGIVYFSQDSHYSVRKNLHFLNMPNIMIRSHANGQMDYDDLRESLKVRRDVPPIIFANIGTTMKEARDDVGVIRGILDELALERHYIHSDAALCGGYAAYLEPRPSWDFADGADSIAISGHKFFGTPMPCGVVLARAKNVERIARSVAYIGSFDTTVTGSRNGLSPLALWCAIHKLGEQGIRDRIRRSLEVAEYAEVQFNKAGISAWRNPQSITVVFQTPAAPVRDKWQLASSDGISHVICMPHISHEQIDALLADIRHAGGEAA